MPAIFDLNAPQNGTNRQTYPLHILDIIDRRGSGCDFACLWRQLHTLSLLDTNLLTLGAMAEKGKLIIGFDTNCVPDLDALLDDGKKHTQKRSCLNSAVWQPRNTEIRAWL